MKYLVSKPPAQIFPFMKRYGSRKAAGVTKKYMAAALSDFPEPQVV